MNDATFFAGLVPDAARAARAHRDACHGQGLSVVFLWGLRTWSQQMDLYAEGRAMTARGWVVVDEKLVVTHALPDQSAHCRGAAYDVAPLDQHDRVDWKRLDLFQAVAELAPVGLTWGGTFPSPDNDHFELTTWRDYPFLSAPPISTSSKGAPQC